MLDYTTGVKAAEFVRNFSRYRELANSRPITITHHGKKTHVLLPIKDFEDVSEVRDPDHDPYRQLTDFAEWMDDGLVVCSRDLRIKFVNRAIQAITGASTVNMIGKSLADMVPEAEGSLILVHARRAATGNTPSNAEIPSPFHDDAWLNVRCIPLGDQIVVSFKDITEEVQRNRLGDVKTALLEGMSVLGTVAFARLSIRGTIDQVGEPFCEMVDLPENRLIGIALSDLLDRSDRIDCRDAIELVLRGEGSRKISASFLRNDGSLMTACISLVQLNGVYGAEGLIALIQPAE